jgi:hypothetical protein
MRHLSLPLLAAIIVAGAVPTTHADDARTFSGVRRVVSGLGTNGCETRPLTLRLQNGIISDKAGCQSTIDPTGRFKGSCPSGNVTLYFDGVVSGDTVALDVSRVGRGWECKYHADLKERAEQ